MHSRRGLLIRWLALIGHAVAGAALAAAPAPRFVSPQLEPRVSWIGNTYPGNPKWTQQDIEALCVLADGTVYTNVPWDEGGGNVGAYQDGELLGFARHTHGWGAEGGRAVAANSKYLFFSMVMTNEHDHLIDPDTWPPAGKRWGGVSRRLRGDIQKPAPFAGGKGGKGDTLKGCFLPVIVAPDAEREAAQITGLAADDSRLYVSDSSAGAVRVFDVESMREIAAWPAERPGPLALDAQGRLWMLGSPAASSGAATAAVGWEFIARFDPERGAIDPAIRIVPEAADRAWKAFCLTSRGALLAIGAGPSQQMIRIEQPGGANEQRSRLGVSGGVRSAAGAPQGSTGDWRLNEPIAVGVDAAENTYIAHHGGTGGGSTVLESYSLDGKLRWRLLGLTFVDLADVDPGDDAQVFTKEERFTLDYSQPPGKEWSYAAYTVDRLAYPDDPRLHIWSGGAWIRRLEGRRVQFVLDMNDDRLQVYRFDRQSHGEIAIPSGLFAPKPILEKQHPGWPANQPQGEWIWRDANGDGHFDAAEYESLGGRDAPAAQSWWVDSRGGVWRATEKAGLRYWPLEGFDARGNPRWSYAGMKTLPAPPEFQAVKRLRYLPESDTLFLAGVTAEHKNQHWKPSGPVLARYEHVLGGGPESFGSLPRPRWLIVAPYAPGSKGHESCEPMGFDVAGDYLFVPYTGAAKQAGVKTGHVEVFRADDGASVGHFEPSAEVGEIGLQDLRECLRAWRRADGEYLVFLEDDYKAKVVMYRWRP